MQQEDLVEDHVRVAKVMRVADAGNRLSAVALDDLPHLLRRQVGMEPLAEFEGKGVGGGRHGGVGYSG